MSKFIDRILGCVHPEWRKVFDISHFKSILRSSVTSLIEYFIDESIYEIEDKHLLPDINNILRAFAYVPPKDVRVVIIGQDPYPAKEQAMGLSFSVPRKVGVSKSMMSVFPALINDGVLDRVPSHSDLTYWAKQGVLLLNKYLTKPVNIKDGEIVGGASLAKHEFWSDFVNTVVNYITLNVSNPDCPIVFMLWGRDAQTVIDHIGCTYRTIDNTKEDFERKMSLPEAKSGWPEISCLVLCTNHPSPRGQMRLAAPKTFKNCCHFKLANQFLVSHGISPIDWKLDPPADKKITVHVPTDTAPDLTADIPRKHRVEDHILEVADMLGLTPESKGELTPAEEPPAMIESDLLEIEDDESPGIDTADIIGKRVVAACDGSWLFKKNIGGYGVYFPPEWRGHPTHMSGNIYGKLPFNMLTVVNGVISQLPQSVKGTNQRAELLGFIYTIDKVIKCAKCKISLLIFTDSDYVEKIVNERIWNWDLKNGMRKGKYSTRNAIANLDLIVILKHMLDELPKKLISGRLFPDKREDMYSWTGLTVVHVRSHQDAPLKPEMIAADTPDSIEYLKWYMNNEADKLADLGAVLDHNVPVINFKIFSL